MHYDDKYVINNNQLEVGIYKHETTTDGVFSYQLSSIQSCKLIHPLRLSKLIELFDGMDNQKILEESFPELIDIKTEEFCKLTLRVVDDDFKITKVNEYDWKNFSSGSIPEEIGLH